MSDGLLHFPEPQSLAELKPDELPMPRPRAVAIRELSRAVLDGRVVWDAADSARLVEQLLSLPGIGPWTAQYVAMRAAHDPDAFLHTDLVLRKVITARLGITTGKQLLARAEAWRPWRAYAGMYLWAMAR